MINPNINMVPKGLQFLAIVILFILAFIIEKNFGLKGVDIFFSIFVISMAFVILLILIRFIILAVKTLKERRK